MSSMGYNTRPDMIEQNAELLDMIQDAVSDNRELKLEVRDANEISTEQYRLRRILAACDNHPTAYGGKFSRLGQRVILRVDAPNGVILVQPKGGVNVKAYRTSEKDVIAALPKTEGNMTILEFWPSPGFSLTDFEQQARGLGWEIFPAAMTKGEDGKLEIPAERLDSSSDKGVGFGALG